MGSRGSRGGWVGGGGVQRVVGGWTGVVGVQRWVGWWGSREWVGRGGGGPGMVR